MAQYNLGKVSIRPRGAYSATANYTPLDMVTNLGGAWLCITSASGVEPGVYSTWANYWLNITKGVQSVSVTSPATGKATISITLSDGTTNSITIDTAAIGEGAVGTNELANQSVTLDKLAPNARTNVKTISLPAASWAGSGPYTQAVTVAGSTAQSQINIQGDQAAIAAANSGGFAVLISNTAGTLTAYAIGTKPTVDLTLQVTIVELSGATGTIVGAPLSGSGVADGSVTLAKLANDVTAVALGGIDMVKVWENASPNSAFGTAGGKTTIALDLSEADEVIIDFRAKTRNGPYIRLQLGIGVLGCASICVLSTQTYASFFEMRNFTTSSTGIEFDVGAYLFFGSGDGVAVEDNTRAVPIAIYVSRGATE